MGPGEILYPSKAAAVAGTGDTPLPVAVLWGRPGTPEFAAFDAVLRAEVEVRPRRPRGTAFCGLPRNDVPNMCAMDHAGRPLAVRAAAVGWLRGGQPRRAVRVRGGGRTEEDGVQNRRHCQRAGAGGAGGRGRSGGGGELTGSVMCAAAAVRARVSTLTFSLRHQAAAVELSPVADAEDLELRAVAAVLGAGDPLAALVRRQHIIHRQLFREVHSQLQATAAAGETAAHQGKAGFLAL